MLVFAPLAQEANIPGLCQDGLASSLLRQATLFLGVIPAQPYGAVTQPWGQSFGEGQHP